MHQALACRFVPNKIVRNVQLLGAKRLHAARFTPSGRQYVASSFYLPSQKFLVFNVCDRFLRQSYVINCVTGRGLCSFGISPDEQFLIYCSEQHNDCMWIASMADHDQHYTAHRSISLQPSRAVAIDFKRVNNIEFSSDSASAFVVHPGSFRLYDLQREDATEKTFVQAGEFGCYLDDECRVVLLGDPAGRVSVYDLRTVSEERPIPVCCYGNQKGHIQSIASRKDGRYFLTSGSEDSLKLWDLRKSVSPPWLNDFIKVYRDSTRRFGGTFGCNFSPLHSTGQRMVYCMSGLSQLLIFDLHSAKTLVSMDCTPHGPAACELSWHPYHMMIAAALFEEGVNLVAHRSDILV